MSENQKPEVRQVSQPAVPTQIQAVRAAPAIDMTSPAFQAAVAAAVQLALAQQAPVARSSAREQRHRDVNACVAGEGSPRSE